MIVDALFHYCWFYSDIGLYGSIMFKRNYVNTFTKSPAVFIFIHMLNDLFRKYVKKVCEQTTLAVNMMLNLTIINSRRSFEGKTVH